MTWAALFERARGDTTVEQIRDRLAARRSDDA